MRQVPAMEGGRPCAQTCRDRGRGDGVVGALSSKQDLGAVVEAGMGGVEEWGVGGHQGPVREGTRLQESRVQSPLPEGSQLCVGVLQ